jgi:hypothetical protein
MSEESQQIALDVDVPWYPYKQFYECLRCRTKWITVSMTPILEEPYCPDCDPESPNGPTDYAAITRDIATGG